ncbi:MAG TPA: type II secretion system F family protein [bacterium]|nr:type II secretion system F family protein [bacterium]
MATYAYVGRNGLGEAVSGAIEGDTDIAAISRLQEMGFVITALKRKSAQPKVEDLLSRFQGVKLKDLTIFTRQLATMINAGLAIIASLTILQAQTASQKLREILAKVKTDVEGGQPLSDALGKHPEAFNQLFTNMVRAGETGGALDDVLSRLSGFLEAELKLRQRVKSAMVYPVLIACAAGGIVMFIVFFVLPKFVAVFQDLDVPLPLPTRFLIWFTITTRRYWYIYLLIMVVCVYGFRYYVGTTNGRRWFDRFKLRMPLFGPINRNVVMARFSRTLGTLIHSGVPILSALDVVAKATANVELIRAIDGVRTSIREGESISGPLQASGMFPAMVVQMVAVGERTGALDTMLAKVADFYDTEVEYAVAALTSILEPALIMVMGGIVGFIVIAFYLPLFTLVGALH